MSDIADNRRDPGQVGQGSSGQEQRWLPMNLGEKGFLDGKRIEMVNPEVGDPPVIDESEIKPAGSADFIIIGCGHGGVQTMLAAAEGGADVLVLEKKTEKAHSWLGEQVGTFNSRFFIEQGLGPYDLDEIVMEFVRCGAYLVNQEIINTYVKKSGEMLDHMIYDVVGIDADVMRPNQWNIHQAAVNKYPVINGGCKSWAGTLQFRGKALSDPEPMENYKGFSVNRDSRLPEFERYALDRALELGARIEYMREAVLLEKSGGRVTSVIAKDREGGYHRYTAKKGVVLAAGDAMNGGQKMGIWAGGKIENTPGFSAGHGNALVFGAVPFVTLNGKGRRFCNESMTYGLGYASYRQPKGTISAVSDKKWLQNVSQSGVQHKNSDFGSPWLSEVIADMEAAARSETQPYPVRNFSLSEPMKAPIYCAWTLPELADLIGYEGESKKNWLDSIERYNEICRKGHDDDFGKDSETLIPVDEAPFYGFVSGGRGGSLTDAPGKGFMVNADFGILDENHDPIPGLYAAGICVGGRYAIYYPTPCGGNYIGMAMTLGRELGRKLAADNR